MIWFVPTKQGWQIEQTDEDDAVIDRQGPFETLEDAYRALKPAEPPAYSGSFDEDQCLPISAPG